jgi:ribosome-associated protein
MPRDEEPFDEEVPKPTLRRSRTSEKLENEANELALADLSQRFVDLPKKRLEEFGLPELLLEALAAAKKITSAPAKARHMRHIRGHFRAMDWPDLLRRLDAQKAGLALELEDSEAVRWATDLPIQGDRGLARFVEAYPNADRARLRQLLMNVVRAPEEKRTKARKQLEALVDGTIREALARGTLDEDTD